MNKIPILFTTFNRLAYTKQSLSALIENTGDIGEIIIIDNASTDGTVEYLKTISDPKIKNIIYNDKNVGVAGAMNQFHREINYQRPEYFAKVDNDTIVPALWLESLSAAIKSAPTVDFIQAKHYFVMERCADWDDLLANSKSIKVLGNNLILSGCVGGSGIIGRTVKLGRLDEDKGLLVGWTSFQSESKDTVSAFYDGVEIKILDIEDYNKLKMEDLEYHIETGRMSADFMPPVSIIIPVIREDRVNDCIETIKRNAVVPDTKYEIITEVDYDRIGCPKMVKKLTERAMHDFVMFLGDDTVPQRGFLTQAMFAMQQLPDGWGMVGLNDGIHDGAANCATHWLAHKNLLKHCENNEFFYTGYLHCCCDKELTDIAIENGRYIWAENAKLIHNHPIRDLSFEDSDYVRVYSREQVRKDQKLYLKRKKGKGYFKLGIGFPLTDEKVYSSFTFSWTLMEKPDFTLFLPQFPGPIEKIRNNIVVQALREDCTHLLMMDTDQNYPNDTIPKLLSHKKDVVAGYVHRRYPPFDPIMYRGVIGDYHHVPDDECFSGKLVEVDATGAACMLFNTDVFLDIPYPWFEHYVLEDGRVVGEDIDFCSKMQDAKYDVFVDTSIEIGHISTVEITRDFYKLYKKVKGFEWRPPPLDPDVHNINI